MNPRTAPPRAAAQSETTAEGACVTLPEIERWFENRGYAIDPFQREAWDAFGRGASGLLHAPTGSGKSFAAWFGPLLHCTAPKGRSASWPLRVLWITPLRALAIDLAENLSKPLEELGLPWTLGSRTGDTSNTERARQQRRLPTALITTPESLSLLLSYRATATQLAGVQAVVVDEWHELLGSKRGVLLELSLSRLRRLTANQKQPLRVWGLSATLGNLDQAASVLLPQEKTPLLIAGTREKQIDIRSLLPEDMATFPWSGHMGLVQRDAVITAIEQASSTLLFTNTRSQAERWFEALQRARLDWIGQLGLHHGSLEPSLRRAVEERLRSGHMKCVVATSSLDLGVDFTPVEQVLQVGSPKGVARLLQRAGRSGHRPDSTSVVYCVPTHALELLEIAGARCAADAGAIEAREPLRNCLDVLSQHLVTLALAGGVDPDEVRADALATHAFAGLSAADWAWVLDFVTRGGQALKAYPQYQRLERRGDLLVPASAGLAQRHRMAIGTITADAAMKVQLRGGGYLGMIEESFISRLQPGDAFLFSGRALELLRVRDMVAQVKPAASRRLALPRWAGGRLPLSSELADAVLERLDAFSAASHSDDRAALFAASPELARLAPVLALQAQHSALPSREHLLIERCRSREGSSLFIYPFAGRLVHEAMAAVLAWRAAQQRPLTFSFSVNDYGFELLSAEDWAFDETELRPLFAPQDLDAHVLSAVNAAEMAKRQFRDIARIAGLVFQGYPGASKTTRQVQASTGLLYDVLVRHDPDNALPQQATRELLEAQFERARLEQTFERCFQQPLRRVETKRLSPLAFPLWSDRLATRLSSESWQDRVVRMQARLACALPSASP